MSSQIDPFFNLHFKKKSHFILIAYVVFFHALLLFFLICYSPHVNKTVPKKIIVRTISIKPKTASKQVAIEITPPVEVSKPIEISPIEEPSIPAPIEFQVSEEPSPIIVENEIHEEVKEVHEEQKKEITPPVSQQVQQKQAQIKQTQQKSVEAKTVKPQKIEKKETKKVQTSQKVKKEEQPKKTITKQEPTKKQSPTPQKKKVEIKKEDSRVSAINAALSKLEKSQNDNAKKRTNIKNNASEIANTPESPKLNTDTEINFSCESQEKYTGYELTYYDELVSRLKLTLRLPEYGNVHLKMTLSSTGKVLKVLISNSKSLKNQTYIEKKLPTLSFPSFGVSFKGSKEHTFSLNVFNDLKY